MFIYFSKCKRAGILFSALFLFQVCLAETTSEGPEQLIEKAQNLVLQKDRIKASQILIQGIDKFKNNEAFRAQLKESLDQITRTFITERAHQVFELGLAMYFADKENASDRLEDALKLEPNNITVLAAYGRSLLRDGNAEAATRPLTTGVSLNPYASDIQFLLMKAKIEMNGMEDQVNPQRPNAIQKALWWSVLAQNELVNANRPEIALKYLDQSLNADPSFPEAYYWLFRTRVSQNQVALTEARKYLSLCSGLTEKRRRKYIDEPHLCLRTKEAETYVEAQQRAKARSQEER